MVPWFEIEQCEKKNGWLFDIGDEILANYMGIIYWLVFFRIGMARMDKKKSWK